MSLESLKPISGDHSVSRVVASLHLPQSLLKPDIIFERLKDELSLKNYQKKSLTQTRTFSFSNQITPISSDEGVSGFVFEQYDSSGKLDYILRLSNVEEQASFSLENRIYKDWDLFFPKFIEDLKAVSSKVDLFFHALSLTYIDEFTWESEEDIDVKSIFKTESDLLNGKFLNSKNGSLICITQGVTSSNSIEEKVDISFHNSIKRISISHQCALKFNTVQFFSNGDQLEEPFNKAHELNKSMLKEVLSDESLSLINIK